MSLNTGSGNLSHALKTLRVHWGSTEMEWRDDVRRDFEENHLKPIEQELLAAVGAIGTLDQVLIKALQECE